MRFPVTSLRIVIVAFLLLTLLAASALIIQPALADDPFRFAPEIDHFQTGFDPAKNMLPVRNDYKVPQNEIEHFPKPRSIADDGRCRGINETNVSYFEKYGKDPTRPPLAELGAQIESKYPGILDKAAASAQITASAQGLHFYGDKAMPSGVSAAAQLVRDMRQTAVPQLLSIWGNTGSGPYGHSISVYGVTVKQSGGGKIYIFNVADPNYEPGSPENKTRTIIYNEGSRFYPQGWAPYESGGFPFNHISLRRDPSEPTTWKKVVSYFKGTPASKTDAQRNPIQISGYYLKNLSEAEQGRVLPPPRLAQSADGVEGMSVTKDEVGGVLIQFDPQAFTEPNRQQDAQFDAQIQSFVDSNRTGTLVIRGTSRAESFETLSLRQWLTSGDPTLGGLTRVRGYIVRDDDVVLIGKRDASMPAIDGDVLTVALNATYLEGATPFVSLDPNPLNYFGPQQVRVGGIANKFEQSEFVRVMLDADYDMKRISLGELAVAVPNFQSWYEILRQSENAEPGASRAWLTPISFTVGDVFESGPAVIFQSEVQVLTERMKDFNDYSASPGESRAEDDLAVQLMTRHFSELEREVPNFYRLHGLFDVAKLGTLLRYKHVASSVLEQVARRPIRVVPHKTEYDGIGPKVVEGTMHVIGGGAVAEVRFAKSGFSQSNAVNNFLNGNRSISLERSLELAPAVNPDLLVNAAARAYSRGDLQDCIANANAALDADETAYQAYLYRALANTTLGNSEEAISDLDRVVTDLPQMQGLRGVVKLYTRDIDGANADVDECARKFPDLEEAWLFNAQVKVYSLDFVGAQAALDHLFQKNGMSLEAHSLKATATMLARMDPKEAGNYVKQVTQFPLPLAEVLWRAYAATHSFDANSARKAYEQALELAERESDNPKVKDLFAVERILFLLTTLTAKAETPAAEANTAAISQAKARLDEAETKLRSIEALWRAQYQTEQDYREQEKVVAAAKKEYETALLISRPAIKYAQRLIDRHPDWASGYVARSLGLLGSGTDHAEEASALLGKAFATGNPVDPLLHDLELYYGHSIKDTFYALEYMLTAEARDSTLDQRLSFLRGLSNDPTTNGMLARSLVSFENAFEERKKATDKAQVTLNREVQDTVRQAIAKPPGNDLAEMILYSRMLMFYCAWEVDSDPGEAIRAARAVQLNLPQDDATPEAVSIAGLLRLQAFDFLANAYFARANSDSKLKQYVDEAAVGNLRLEEIRDRSKLLGQQAMQESKRLDPQVVNKMLMEIYLPNVAEDVQDSTLNRARSKVIETTDYSSPTPMSPSETNEDQASPSPTPLSPLEAIDSARTSLDEQRNSVAPKQTEDTIAATVDGIVNSAQTPVDLKLLEVYFLRLTTVGQLMAVSDGNTLKAAKISALQQSISARLQLRGMKLLRSTNLPATNHRSLVWPSPPIWRRLPWYVYVLLVVGAISAIAFWRVRHRRSLTAH
jgi:hypothetical protein